MSQLSVELLTVTLLILICISAFFSSAETGMMAINRYRLRHLANHGNKSAKRTLKLLQRPDRLIGIILIGNNFVNILASSLATIIAMRLWGTSGVAIATISLTIILLIFGEVTPKSVAVTYPEKIAFPASALLLPLLKLLYPFVTSLNWICAQLVRPFGIKLNEKNSDQLSTEELRSLVNNSGLHLPAKNRGMLLGILDLEQVSVDDIMIPRHEIVGIDIDQSWSKVLERLKTIEHTRVPVYKEHINNIIGILHMRKVVHLLDQQQISLEVLLKQLCEPYFVPENTQLHIQLINFQKNKQRTALIVDEYGDIIGLVTLEDILEEIVGKFTTDTQEENQQIIPDVQHGGYIIDGSLSIREVNRMLNWNLPVDSARTISGLIMEKIECIPDSNLGLRLDNYLIETLLIKDNRIKTVRITTDYKDNNDQE